MLDQIFDHQSLPSEARETRQTLHAFDPAWCWVWPQVLVSERTGYPHYYLHIRYHE